MTANNQTIISILGMHRSGTSCLTGCLQDCGLFLGDVVNKAPHNLKGNKENLTIRSINDQVLLHNGGSWDHPPEQLSWNDELRDIRDQHISNYLDCTQWGFKDPRTLLTLPFWLEALPNLKFVGSFRHPIAVARSIQEREKSTTGNSFTLWEIYNLKLIEYLETYNFPLVCFDWPTEIYLQNVFDLSRKIGLNTINKPENISFYESNLVKQNVGYSSINLPTYILDIYENLYHRAGHFRLSRVANKC